MPKLLKGDTRPVAQNLAASFLWEYVPKGITILMTWLVAHQASLQGWALPWVLLAGAAIFCILTIASYYILKHRTVALIESERPMLPAIETRLIEDSVPIDSVQLEIRFNDYKRHTPSPNFRIGVYNPGPHVARNVELWVELITGPEGETFRGHLPHRLQAVDTGQQHCDINPDTEELFDFSAFALLDKKPDGILFKVGRIRLNRLHNKRIDSEYLYMGPNEHLHIFVKVRCGNGPPRTAIFYAQTHNPREYIGIEIVRIDNYV